ncbi:protein rolling stone-like [Neocloeon triangulifer]|uniref:protein rolling stone-like n=1 Tax=Neocloeon triangulifer TaxID=2078957 RepID=UPI00286ECE0B|nr:protein rolling stone-like [Neocloeon triangulifer]
MLLLAYKTLKKEFSKEYRSFNCADPTLFQQSQWQNDGRRRTWYVCYKWLVCIYLLYGLIFDWTLYEFNETNCKGSKIECRLKWFVYCTSWAYLLLTCQALMAAYLATTQPAASARSPFSTFHKIYWMVNNMASAVSLNVTLVYWTLVYSPDKPIDFSNVKGHVTNSLLVLLDLMVVAQPVRLLHAVLPMTVGLVYASFTVVFFYMGGTNRQLEEAIYPHFNWRWPPTAAFVGACCEAGILLMHVLVWCVFLARRKTAALVIRKNGSDENEDIV